MNSIVVDNTSCATTPPFVQLINGDCVDSKTCYEKCLELDQKDLSAWKRLARRMSTTTKTRERSEDEEEEETAVVRGKTLTKDDCIKMVVSLSK